MSQSVDERFEAMVQQAVSTVVHFNVEMGEEEPSDEDRQWCEELTRRVFEAIGLHALLRSADERAGA